MNEEISKGIESPFSSEGLRLKFATVERRETDNSTEHTSMSRIKLLTYRRGSKWVRHSALRTSLKRSLARNHLADGSGTVEYRARQRRDAGPERTGIKSGMALLCQKLPPTRNEIRRVPTI